jgi:hypothetical protein
VGAGYLWSNEYWSLFSILDGLLLNTKQYDWNCEHNTEVNTRDMVEDMRHTMTEVKIAFPMAHNTLTRTEEFVK